MIHEWCANFPDYLIEYWHPQLLYSEFVTFRNEKKQEVLF